MIEGFKAAKIVTTYQCNNDCNWCYAKSGSQGRRNIFPYDKIDGTLDLFKSLGIERTTLLGGEPTVYPHLFKMLESHADKGITTGIITNGRRLSNRAFTQDLKDSGLSAISASIEGHDPQSHDVITNVEGSYVQAVEGIKNAHRAGITVYSNTVISKENHQDLNEIIESMASLPIQYIRFSICGPCLDGEDNEKSLLSPYDATKSFEEAYHYARGLGIDIKLVTPAPLCYFDPNERRKLIEEGAINDGRPCQLSSGKRFVLDYNGDIIPCSHVPGSSDLNIWEGGSTMSSNEFLLRYNNSQSSAKLIKGKHEELKTDCLEKKCEETCSGGCPLFWTTFSPSRELYQLE